MRTSVLYGNQEKFNIDAVNDYPPIRFEIRFERKFPIRRSLVIKKSIYIAHRRETSNASVRCEQKRIQRLSETVLANNRWDVTSAGGYCFTVLCCGYVCGSICASLCASPPPKCSDLLQVKTNSLQRFIRCPITFLCHLFFPLYYGNVGAVGGMCIGLHLHGGIDENACDQDRLYMCFALQNFLWISLYRVDFALLFPDC